MKYIIELEKIEGIDLYRAKGANTLVFDEKEIKNILTPYEEEPEVDWTKVQKDTKVLVSDDGVTWKKRYFSHFCDGLFYAFCDGATSWSDNATVGWKYCKLAEEE